MKYFSFLLLLLIVLTACGKKTDPVAIETLESAAPPEKVVIKATPEGFFIANNEDGALLIAKGIHIGDKCPEFTKLKVLAPKTDFIDTDVKEGQDYSYQIVQRTIKYKLVSEPRIYPVTYSIPPFVESATVENNSVTIKPSGDFIRLDVMSKGKSMIQTGKINFEITSDISEFSIVLTDKYGNKGVPYSVAVKREKPKTLDELTGLTTAYLGGSLRIVWDSVENAESYETKVCDSSCETYKSNLPFINHKKAFDKCVDITVKALNSEATSKAKTTRYCK